MNPFKWLACLFRSYHRFMVPDLAVLLKGNYRFTGRCRDCGARRTKSSDEWRQVLSEGE